MVEIQNLSKSYGNTHAIQNLNFKVNRGEVVGFLGPNGAGKTTTMKIITGYMAPTSGVVKVAGYDVFENPIEVKRHIGYLPETPPVYTDMYVSDYLSFVAKLKGVAKDKVKAAVKMAMEKTHIEPVQNRLIGNLSKGYRQRVGIAQALVSSPELLILDEPTVGLDPKQVAEIRTLIKELKGQHTIILSTHILPEVQATCEKIIIINRGVIAAEDSLDRLNQRVHGAHRMYLKVKRADQSLRADLEKLDGVLKLEESSSGVYLLDVDKNDETTEHVAEVVVSHKAGLLELKNLDMSLEDVFLKLTAEDRQAVKES